MPIRMIPGGLDTRFRSMLQQLDVSVRTVHEDKE